MAEGSDFHLPGYNTPLDSPEFYVTRVIRNFQEASLELGRAIDTLVVRLASSGREGAPDYQIQTRDGIDAIAYSGETGEPLSEDRSVQFGESDLQDEMYTADHARDWLNQINGEGPPGGPLNPILSDTWTDTDYSSPKDSGPE
jgi:hypothetical protein